MTSPRRWSFGWVAVALGLAACGGARHRPDEPADDVREVLAGAIGCAPGSMHVDYVGDHVYLLEGCGRLVVYRCERPGYDLGARLNPRCARIGGARMWRRLVRAWLASEGGDGLESSPQPASTDAGSTLTDPRPRREPEAPATARDGASVETAARALVEQERDAILECAARDSIAVLASWTATGEVTVSLRGELEGGDEEACIRAATGHLQLDGATEAGQIIHLVRRMSG